MMLQTLSNCKLKYSIYLLVTILMGFTAITPVYAASTTITQNINTATDDVTQDNTTFNTSDTTVWLGNGQSTTASYTGLRFSNIPLPKNATITSALLQVYSSQSQWNQINISIAGENVGNSLTFTTNSKPSQRTLTTQKITLNNNVSWSANTTYALPDLSTIIQAINSRSDWQSGNAISLIIKGNGNAYSRKFIKSYEGNTTTAPKLTITYTTTSSPAPTAVPTPTFTPTPLPTPTATPIITASPTVVPIVTPTETPSDTPQLTASPSAVPVTPNEWTQHGHDAQHTSYTDQVVTAPWKWKWAWNGPDATGNISAGKFMVPRDVQPVTGNGKVYIGSGAKGVYALNEQTGAVAWNVILDGDVNSTVAYDATTNAVFALTTHGTLYKLDSTTGSTISSYTTSGTSTLPLPPIVLSDRVIFGIGAQVYALNKATLASLWTYNTNSTVQTPPTYSPSKNTVVIVTQDLFVHAIDNSNGIGKWRIKPTSRNGGDPGGTSTTLAESSYGWPVIAEGHGYVLVKYRLEWNALWTWNPWPISNTQQKTNLQNRPDQQALFALNLDNGTIPFIANIGHGGYGDGNYIPMGPQPVVKKFNDGKEVVYTIIRGSSGLGYDGRWDSHIGEMTLDNTTVPGYNSGDVRFIQYKDQATYFLTDEQPNLSMSGDYLLAGHWEAGQSVQITDRTDSKGTWTNQITTSLLPHIVTSQDTTSCSFSVTHYCSNGLTNTRSYPPGFFIYYNKGAVYDTYYSEYSTWVVSNNSVYFRSTDGAIVALQSGNPQANATINKLKSNLALAIDWIQSLPKMFSLLSPQTASASEPKIITVKETSHHIGEEVQVEGEIKIVVNSTNKAVILGFKVPHQGAFKVLIKKAVWDAFSKTAAEYREGMKIRVKGTLKEYQGDPVIYATSPSQIEIIN